MPCDVFISYSHLDDGFPHGWVSTLHDRLEAAVATTAPGLDVSIWRDQPNLRRSENFTDRIRTVLEEAQVLLCVLSPAYLSSGYCGEELDFFVRRRRKRVSRLVEVQKKRMRVVTKPEPFQNMIGFKFHEEQSDFELSANDPRFDQAVAPLAREIVQIVETGRAPRQGVLVLATRDREGEGKCLANDLEYTGVNVVPSAQAPLPGSKRDRRTKLEDLAKEADFAVLLLGLEYSEEIETTYDLLAARWPEEPRRCLFAMPNGAVQAPEQIAFLEKVGASGAAFDFCDRPQDVLPETERLLKALREQANRTPTVFLSYLKSSRDHAASLRDSIRALSNPGIVPQGLDPTIRILDAYGDGDSPQMRTQTGARDIGLRVAHGALALVDQPGAFLFSALSDFGDTFPGSLDQYVGIYVADPAASVPAALASRYGLILPDAGPVPAWVQPDAKRVTLEAFLKSIRERARNT